MTAVPAVTLRTAHADETKAVAAAIALLLGPGDVVALSGELGAGKTCFVQGAAASLGVDIPVTSPTFVLMKQYRGTVDIVHADVYRLDRINDVLELGDEVFAPDVVTFVEWADAIRGALPEDRLDIELLHVEDSDTDGDERRVRLQPHGDWASRRDEVLAAVSSWVEEN